MVNNVLSKAGSLLPKRATKLYFGLNNFYSQKSTYVNTAQMVQDLTVSAALIYKSSPETLFCTRTGNETLNVTFSEKVCFLICIKSFFTGQSDELYHKNGHFVARSGNSY